MVFCEHLLFEKTLHLWGMFQSGLGNPITIILGWQEKKEICARQDLTQNWQSPEYIGDKVKKHQNV